VPADRDIIAEAHKSEPTAAEQDSHAAKLPPQKRKGKAKSTSSKKLKAKQAKVRC
jgi:hypothetical protein